MYTTKARQKIVYIYKFYSKDSITLVKVFISSRIPLANRTTLSYKVVLPILVTVTTCP